MISVDIEKYLDRRWWAGGPRDIWISYAEVVGKIINENKLKPVADDVLQIHVPGVVMRSRAETPEKMMAQNSMMYPWWYRGGMRIPHLHYRGDIYMLDSRQWSEFSHRVLEDFSRKLAGAKTVSYDQVMGLSDAVNEVS